MGTTSNPVDIGRTPTYDLGFGKPCSMKLSSKAMVG